VSARLLPAATVALLLVFLQLRSGIELSILTVAAMALFAYVVVAGGRLLAALVGERGTDPSPAWVLGLLAMCLAIYGLTLLLPISAGAAFGIVGAVVLVLDALLWRWRASRLDARALAAFALAAALTAAWCSEAAGAYQVVRSEGMLPLWSDYFFHGAIVSQFGDPRALGQGSIYLAGYPSTFYHFASYQAAAAFAGVLDQPGLPLSAAIWLPLGFLAMLAGGHTLGVRLAGPAGGIAALAALALLPDASNYGLRNGWFSFHWTLFAHAGAAYALGAAFVSLALLERWQAGRARAALVASLLLALSMLLFRAQVFALYLPAWSAAAAVCWASDRRRQIGWLMVAVLAIGAAAASQLVAEVGHWRLGAPALGELLWYLHTGQEPTAYTGVYAGLRNTAGAGPLFAAGIGLALAAALGAFVLALPLAGLVGRARGALRPIDTASGYLVLCWLLLVLFAPVPWHGDPSDFTHRSFVLLYGACAIWTLCLLVRAARKPLWLPLLALALLALPAVVVTAGGMTQPKFSWGKADSSARVPPGLVEAARFMRAAALAGDSFAVSRLSMQMAPFDLPTQLCALSGMPAFLSRPYLESIKDAPRRELVQQRFAALERVASLSEHGAALQALAVLGVRWYVSEGQHGPRWDPDHSRAAFRSGTIALYRIP
jgi:hypothetical protein